MTLQQEEPTIESARRTTRLDVLLPAAVNAPLEARRAVGRLELEREQREVVLLLVTELVSNSVRHAGLHEVETIRLSARSEPGLVRVSVSDHGRGFAPEQASAAAGDHHGFGLLLVERLADRWGVEGEGSTTVWFQVGTGSD